jgi:hypothetical protein
VSNTWRGKSRLCASNRPIAVEAIGLLIEGTVVDTVTQRFFAR